MGGLGGEVEDAGHADSSSSPADGGMQGDASSSVFAEGGFVPDASADSGNEGGPPTGPVDEGDDGGPNQEGPGKGHH
jgi:hypothetical protein